MTAIEFNYQITLFQDKLLGFAHNLTHNTEDAEDLMQDTMLKALKYRDKFASSTNLRAWMYTIMKNTFINAYRRKKVVQFTHDDSESEYILNSFSSESKSPSSNVYLEEIHKQIENLGEDYSVPFLMHYQGFKYKEISDQLELPIGTVKSRIFIARRTLMNQLKDFK